jgi:transcriptional regulator
MYVDKQFKVNDRNEVLGFIDAHPFGQLISNVEGRLFSSHVPLLLSENKNSLLCHLAKRNRQWKEIEGQEILITFQGPHGYISPSWYASRGVPTWNYQVVHVYGRAELITDKAALKCVVDDMSERFEATLSDPWTGDYAESLLDKIVGVNIEIIEIQGKYKLSQNRSAMERDRIRSELEMSGLELLSKAMKNKL